MSLRALNSELAEKARSELNEDYNRINSDIEHIKDWLKKQPHICGRTDDQWLVAFLRGCKYSLERTKEKMDLYYSLRTIAPDLHSIKYNSPLFDEILDLGAYLMLPKTAFPDSARVAILRPGKLNPEKLQIADLFTVTSILQKISLVDDDNAVISGMQWIVDLEGVTMAHMLTMTPTMMKKMIVLSQDATPVRMKGTFYINSSPIFQNIINTLKLLLNEKNKNRLFVFSKLDELYERIPKSVLPIEYGGNGGTVKEIAEYLKEKKQQYSSWLEEDEKYKTDESKRLGKPKTAETLFGIEGSFRQIEFD